MLGQQVERSVDIARRNGERHDSEGFRCGGDGRLQRQARYYAVNRADIGGRHAVIDEQRESSVPRPRAPAGCMEFVTQVPIGRVPVMAVRDHRAASGEVGCDGR